MLHRLDIAKFAFALARVRGDGIVRAVIISIRAASR